MNDRTIERPPSERLYEVAEQQAGYFTTAQAKEAGFSHPQLTYYVGSGRFLRVQWGVYRLVFYPATPNEDLYIAWLGAGPDAVISHDSALVLYDLSDALPARIHLTIPRSASRQRLGLALHTGRLCPQEIARVAGLPVTRTIAVRHAGPCSVLIRSAELPPLHNLTAARRSTHGVMDCPLAGTMPSHRPGSAASGR